MHGQGTLIHDSWFISSDFRLMYPEPCSRSPECCEIGYLSWATESLAISSSRGWTPIYIAVHACSAINLESRSNKLDQQRATNRNTFYKGICKMHFDQLRSLRLFNEVLGKNPQTFSEEFKTSFEFQNSPLSFWSTTSLRYSVGIFFILFRASMMLVQRVEQAKGNKLRLCFTSRLTTPWKRPYVFWLRLTYRYKGATLRKVATLGSIPHVGHYKDALS